MMGGVSASNLADAAMLSRMMVPEMEQKGYSRGFAAAITASGSLITPIIPPGIALILYGLVADVSIRLHVYGRDPARSAVLRHVDRYRMVGGYSSRFKTSSEHWPKPKEVSVALVQAWPALFLIVAVIGGIRANIFTPTEAGAVAVLLVMLLVL